MANGYAVSHSGEVAGISSRAAQAALSKSAVLLTAAGAFVLPFRSLAGLKLGGSFVDLSDALFVLAGLCWLTALLRGAERLVWRRAYAPLLAYVGLCAGSYWVASGKQAWLVHLAAAVYQGGFCIMLAHLLVQGARRQLVVRAWLLGAALTTLFGLAGIALFYLGVKSRGQNPFLWNYGSVPVGNYPRLCVLFRNSNALCNYLVLSIGVAVAFSSELPAALRRHLPHAVAGTLLVALFTLSPGFGGILLLLALWYWWSARANGGWPRARWVLAGGVCAALAFVLLSVMSVVPRGQGDLPLGPLDLAFTSSARIGIWSSVLTTIQKSPLAGQGLGAPLAWVTDVRVLVPHDQWTDAVLAQHFAPKAVDAHNTALSILGQLGLPGLLLFGGFLYYVFKALAASRSPARWALMAALSGGVLYHGLFLSLEEMRHVWLLLGLCLGVAFSQAADTSGFGPESLPASS